MPRKRKPEWDDVYVPLPNHIELNAAYDGCMFETGGPEFEFVACQPPRHVWTIVEGDNGKLYICADFHRVNRIGYLLSEQPWGKSDEYYPF